MNKFKVQTLKKIEENIINLNFNIDLIEKYTFQLENNIKNIYDYIINLDNYYISKQSISFLMNLSMKITKKHDNEFLTFINYLLFHISNTIFNFTHKDKNGKDLLVILLENNLVNTAETLLIQGKLDFNIVLQGTSLLYSIISSGTFECFSVIMNLPDGIVDYNIQNSDGHNCLLYFLDKRINDKMICYLRVLLKKNIMKKIYKKREIHKESVVFKGQSSQNDDDDDEFVLVYDYHRLSIERNNRDLYILLLNDSFFKFKSFPLTQLELESHYNSLFKYTIHSKTQGEPVKPSEKSGFSYEFFNNSPYIKYIFQKMKAYNCLVDLQRKVNLENSFFIWRVMKKAVEESDFYFKMK